jgi:CubicO group peptidase (beta-lactamase class C family)
MNTLSPPVAAALDALFLATNRSDAPGLIIGVALHGRPVYRRAFGLASLEHGVANSLGTRMRIGSTSKQFAALAALLLVEDGLLDLDAGVRTCLPELQPLAPEPTLRQLMTHTSGLRDSLDLALISTGLALRPQGDGLAAQARQREANFPPGEKMIYSNGGYHLLSLAIERVSGMAFEQFLAERIFEPLGMADTRSVPSDLEIHRDMATLHVPQPDGRYRRGLFPSEEVRGEGGIVSTIDDMLRWLAHLRGPHRVGREDSWDQMLATAHLNNGFACRYAMGLHVEPYRGVDVIHHSGTVIGGSCQMLTVPEHALDLIIMSNGAQVSVIDLAEQVVDVVLGDEALPSPARTAAESALYTPLLGATYASPSTGMVFGFADANGKLGFAIHNSPPVPAREEDGALCLDFSRIVTGPYRVALQVPGQDEPAPPTLELDDAGTLHVLTRLPEPPPLAEAGRALVGRYDVPDVAAQARIAFEGDELLLRISSEFGPHVLRLKALAADLFAWNCCGPLAALGGTLRVERSDGRTSGLRLDTLRTRHLHFQRVAD